MGKSTAKLGLVVLGIVLVLVPVLFNFFAHAREKAQQHHCMANLRLIGEGIALYEEDFDAVMPWGSNGNGGDNWLSLADPYFKQLRKACYHPEEEYGELTICPSTPIESFTTGPYSTYGYNRYLGKLKRAHPLAVSPVKVKYPAVTLRVTETCPYDPEVGRGPSLRGIEDTLAPVPDWKAAGLSGPLYAPGWHRGRNNVLWVDGHVSTMTKEEVMLTDSNPDPNVWARLSPKPGVN